MIQTNLQHQFNNSLKNNNSRQAVLNTINSPQKKSPKGTSMTFYEESDAAAITNQRDNSGLAAKMTHNASTLRGSDYNNHSSSKLDALKQDLAKFSKKHALSTKRSEEKLLNLLSNNSALPKINIASNQNSTTTDIPKINIISPASVSLSLYYDLLLFLIHLVLV